MIRRSAGMLGIIETAAVRGASPTQSRELQSPGAARARAAAYSFVDQFCAVGGVFVVTVALARTQPKEEFGTFVLVYAIATFLTAVYNAGILEPFTVFGAGRYRERYPDYLRLMIHAGLLVALIMTLTLLLVWLGFLAVSPRLASWTLLGLALSIGVLVSSTFLRRAFYVQRTPSLASSSSMIFLAVVIVGVTIAWKASVLNGFAVFLILAGGWILAGGVMAKRLPRNARQESFGLAHPRYWQEHWNYARWVLATAFVFQLSTQGYYWLLAGMLSLSEVAELRAMHILVAPVEQIFIAISFLVLPALAAHHAAGRIREAWSLWKRNVVVVTAITGLFAIAIWIVGESVMRFLYAGRFEGVAPLLNVLALSPLLIGVAGTLINALNAAEKPKLVFRAFVSSGIATFALGIPLVHFWGLAGAVIGILISGWILVVVLGISLWRHVYHPWSLQGNNAIATS